MNKILDLIFEDVKNENETKKTAVTLRISALIFIDIFSALWQFSVAWVTG